MDKIDFDDTITPFANTWNQVYDKIRDKSNDLINDKLSRLIIYITYMLEFYDDFTLETAMWYKYLQCNGYQKFDDLKDEKIQKPNQNIQRAVQSLLNDDFEKILKNKQYKSLKYIMMCDLLSTCDNTNIPNDEREIAKKQLVIIQDNIKKDLENKNFFNYIFTSYKDEKENLKNIFIGDVNALQWKIFKRII